MNKFKKLIAFAFILVGLMVVSSCSYSGVKAAMTYTATTNSVTLNIVFDENANLSSKAASPVIKEYTVGDDDKETFNENVTVTFESDNYENAKATASGLKANTKYKFELCVSYNSNQEVITSVYATTNNLGGDAEHPIEISTVEEFQGIKDNASAYYKLTKDLDFEKATLSSLFTSSSKFTGHFDGNGKTISNVVLTATTYSGIFGYTEDAEIKDLTIKTVTGSFSSSNTGTGVLAGYMNNTVVKNVKVSDVTLTFSASSSTSDYSLGGVVGIAEATTLVSVTAESITLDVTQARGKFSAGLLVGKAIGEPVNYSEVDSTNTALAKESVLANGCTATGTIKAYMYFSSGEGFAFVGGLIGNDGAAGLVIDCAANADIDITRYVTSSTSTAINNFTLAVGGLIGGNDSGNGMNVKSSLAYADINVFAGASTEVADEIATLNKTQMTRKTTNVGGLIGLVNAYSGDITSSVAVTLNQNVYAEEYSKMSLSSMTAVNESNVTSKDVNGLPKYYTLDEATSTYLAATAYDKDATYYYISKYVGELTGRVLDKNAKIDGNSTADKAGAVSLFAENTVCNNFAKALNK